MYSSKKFAVSNLKTAKKKTTGFTLLEMLVVLSIIGIFITYSVSQHTGTTQRADVDQKAQILINAIEYSRNYARHTGSRVLLCPGSKNQECKTNTWTDGWTLFQVDPDTTVSTKLEAIRTFMEGTNLVQISAIASSSSETKNQVILNGDGFTHNAESSTFLFCAKKEYQYGQKVTVDSSQTFSTKLTEAELNKYCS